MTFAIAIRSVRRAARMVPVAALVGLVACDSLLEVENPNNVNEDDLQDPTSVAALVNGALSLTADAYANVTRAHITLTDETDWVGSWDASGELERGSLDNTANDLTNTGFNTLAQARWTADEALRLTSEFDAAGTLPSRLLLARANLYSGINYILIADNYEDFAFSSKRESGRPLGESGMVGLFDQAVSRFTAAEEIAAAASQADIRFAAAALRARALWAKALREKLAGGAPADPLIAVPAADEAARQAIAIAPDPDARFAFTFSATTTTNDNAAWINQRNESAFGRKYTKWDPSAKKICSPFNSACREEGILYEDPITGEPDPAFRKFVYEFIEGVQFAPQTVIGVREMRLILAESALASGNQAEFLTQINALRALDGLPPYDPATHAITPRDLLIHSRFGSLVLQPMRRLADLYRFGIGVEQWLPASDAASKPGTRFPIGEEERLANCYFNGSCS